MARAVFNRLSVDIPEGWRDESFVALLGPESAPPRTMTSRRGHVARPSLVIRRGELTEGDVELETLAELQAQAMAAVAPGTRVVARGAFVIETGTGPIPVVTRDYGITDGAHLLQQLHAYLRVDGEVYVAVGSSLVGAELAKAREQFLAIVESLRFA